MEIIGRVATNGWACYYLYLIVANGERLASLPPPCKAGLPSLLLPPLLFVETLGPSAWFLPPQVTIQLATPKPSHTAHWLLLLPRRSQDSLLSVEHTVLSTRPATVPKCKTLKVTVFGASILILTRHRTAFSKVWSCGQSQPTACFHVSWVLRMVSHFFLNDFFLKQECFTTHGNVVKCTF